MKNPEISKAYKMLANPPKLHAESPAIFWNKYKYLAPSPEMTQKIEDLYNVKIPSYNFKIEDLIRNIIRKPRKPGVFF